MIAIRGLKEKSKALREQYAESGGRLKFAEFVERKAQTDPSFFRWLTGNERLADHGLNLSESTRTILLSSIGY